MITIDMRCHKCEYNLRGLDETGLCPECGSSIAVSLREHHGPATVSGRPYLNAAYVGLALIFIGLIVRALVSGGERLPDVFGYPVALCIPAGIIIELGVVVASARFWSASRKTDRREMVVALIISIPFVPIAIFLAFLMLIAIQGC